MTTGKLTREQLINDRRWKTAIMCATANPDDDDVFYYVNHKGQLVQDFHDKHGNILRAIWDENKFDWIGDYEYNLDWDS